MHKIKMTTPNKNLEQKTKKIDWKEWIPVYGIYQIYKYTNKNKPGVLDGENSLLLNAAYQTLSTFAIGTGLYELAKQLF